MIQGNSETQRHIFQEQYHLYIQKLYYINGQDCLFSCISKILDANIVTNHAPVKSKRSKSTGWFIKYKQLCVVEKSTCKH